MNVRHILQLIPNGTTTLRYTEAKERQNETRRKDIRCAKTNHIFQQQRLQSRRNSSNTLLLVRFSSSQPHPEHIRSAGHYRHHLWRRIEERELIEAKHEHKSLMKQKEAKQQIEKRKREMIGDDSKEERRRKKSRRMRNRINLRAWGRR